MKKFLWIVIVAGMIAGCGNSVAPESTPESAPTNEEATAPAPTSAGSPPAMTNMPGLTIGDYEVQPMFEEVIENGHYNISVSGGDVNAVRVWVGAEDPSDTMVVKAEIEHDYFHSHHKVSTPIEAGTRLWIELELPDGSTVKGSTALVAETAGE